MSEHKWMPAEPTPKILKAMTFAGTNGVSSDREAKRMRAVYGAVFEALPVSVSASPVSPVSLEEALEVLERAAGMLSAVAGDIEDGHSLADLRGKYVTALLHARDDARALLSRARRS